MIHDVIKSIAFLASSNEFLLSFFHHFMSLYVYSRCFGFFPVGIAKGRVVFS